MGSLKIQKTVDAEQTLQSDHANNAEWHVGGTAVAAEGREGSEGWEGAERGVASGGRGSGAVLPVGDRARGVCAGCCAADGHAGRAAPRGGRKPIHAPTGPAG
jgi:hypothetical protein